MLRGSQSLGSLHGERTQEMLLITMLELLLRLLTHIGHDRIGAKDSLVKPLRWIVVDSVQSHPGCVLLRSRHDGYRRVNWDGPYDRH